MIRSCWTPSTTSRALESARDGAMVHVLHPLATIKPSLAQDELEETSRGLRARGWIVLRYWEHEDPAEVAGKVAAVVHAARLQPDPAR